MSEHQDSTSPPTVPVHLPTTTGLEQQHAVQAVANHPAKGRPFPSTEELLCLWQGCSEKCPNAEALYEHICERHVGRKSANNLNLTCQWGSCHTTSTKRDHITSHLRIHVSFKPHKCNFCGKAFKRPQDLKKHVKTHADGSVLVRSPEPDARSQDVIRGGGPAKGHAASGTHCFERDLNPAPGQGYPHGAAQYYQSHPPQQSSVHPYGNVYYTLNRGPVTGHVSCEHKKCGYDALNEFVGDLKPRQFDPNLYATAGQWLPGLQNLSLPTLAGGLLPEYQVMPRNLLPVYWRHATALSPGGASAL